MTQVTIKQSKLAGNIFYGMLSWLLPIVPTLIILPIVLEKLGKDRYGVLTLLLGFVSYFFTASLGRVAAKYVAEFVSSGESEKISPVISATLIASTAAALLSTLAVAAAANIIVDDVLRISGELRDNAVLGVYLAAATVLTTAVAQTFILLLQGVHRFDRYFLIANFTSVSFSVGSLIVVWLGFGFDAILVWNVASWLLAGVMALVFVKQALPDFAFTLTIPRQIWSLVLRYAAGIIGYQLFGNVLLLFERGFIMRRFGPEAVTLYVIPMTLAMYIHAFTASLVMSIFPTVNELLASPDKLRELYRNSTKLILWLIVFALLTATVCGRQFLTIWLKRDPSIADQSYWLLVFHTVTFSILALNTVAWHIAEGFRAASINALVTLAWMIIGVVAMMLLSPAWGIDGVGIGRLIGVLPFVPMILLVERRFLGGIGWSFWAECLGRLAICALAAVAGELVITRMLNPSWLTVLAAVAIGAVFYGLLTLFTGYISSSDRETMRTFVSRLRGTQPVDAGLK